jgi:isopentenyldiphosphate isomerase
VRCLGTAFKAAASRRTPKALQMTELIDVLTPEGDPTGVRKPKSEIHLRGHWHRAANVWIVATDGRILLQRRSPRKENNPAVWDVSAAGHLSAGETSIDAAIREVQEELGLRLRAEELRFMTTLRESCVLNRGTYIDNEFHDIFIVRRDVDLASLTLDPEEVAEVKWVRELRPDSTFAPHGEEYALVAAAVGSLH